MMKTKVIDLYEQFQCLAGECPYSCCRGWRVQIDGETYKRYVQEPGPLGFALCMMSTKHKDYGHLMRKVMGKCPFQNGEKLCSLQCKGREDLMPEICKIYPRLSVGYGPFQEVILELSCVHTAQLFLENLGRHEFIELFKGQEELSKGQEELSKEQEEIPVFWTEENDDENFLEFLLEDREEILNYLWSDAEDIQESEADTDTFSYRSLIGKMKGVYEHVYQEYLDIMKSSGEKITYNKAFFSKEILEEENFTKDNYPSFYSLSLLNRILYHWFTGIPRNTENILFYQLLRKYKKHFGKIYEKDANQFFVENMEKMLKDFPEYGKVFYSYYSYLLQETYLRGYGNYYIIKSVVLSSLFTQYLMLFYLVCYLEDRSILQDQAKLIMVVEKALRHNEALEELMMSRIREELWGHGQTKE